MEKRGNFGAELILTAGGAATTWLPRFGNYLIAESMGIRCVFVMYWFVLPVGADA